VPDGDHRVPFGLARIAREGSDVTLIGYSGSVYQALGAADQLAKEDIEAEVIDLRTLRPLDTETIIESVKKTNRTVIVEHAWRFGGFGAELAARIQEKAFDYLDAPVGRIGGMEVPMPYSFDLEKEALPNEAQVVEAVRALF
jgi:pyruvate dehydrogenase E1 component beta subunit